MQQTKRLKVILADDETLVKVGLKSLASWDDNGFEITAEAGNGEEALQLIGQHQPHLLITDIMMPKMDGIELIRKTRELYPDIRILVLSSYDEYKLVREAMKLGASDYLLKLNISRESLDEVLSRLREEILSTGIEADLIHDIDQQSKIAARQDLLRDIVSNIISDRAYLNYRLANLDIDLTENAMYLALIETNMNTVESKFCEDQDVKLLDFVIEQIVSEIANEFYTSYFVKWSFGVYLLIFSPDTSAQTTGSVSQGQIKLMGKTIIEIIKKYANLDASIGISRLCANYLELPAAYKQAMKAISGLFYMGYGKVVFSGEADDADQIEMSDLDDNISDELVSALQISDAASIRRLLTLAQITIQNRHLSRQAVFSFCSQIVHLADYHLGESWKNFQKNHADSRLSVEALFSRKTIRDIIAWLDLYSGVLLAFLAESGGRNSHAMITKAKKYITDNLYKNFSLTEVSEQLGISSSYLSCLFPKYTGMSFTEFVNKIKIIEAQKLIRQGQLKVYEISYRLGYENACYFSKIFKKITGMTPTDYLQASNKI